MARRSSGEGSITRQKGRKWRASIQVHGERRYVYGATRKEVSEKLQSLREQVRRGEPIRAERLTVQEYLERWIEEAVRPSRRARTLDHYDYVRRRLLAPYLGRAQLSRLTALDVQKLLSDLARAGKSARQRQAAYTILRNALGQAVKWGLIATNPADKVARPRISEREIRALNEKKSADSSMRRAAIPTRPSTP